MADKSSGVKVYTKAYCPYCVRAKVMLTQKGISFEEINIENKDRDFIEELFSKTGFRTVPQIFIGDECIGGYDDMVELDSAGKLEAKLAPYK